jgi:hypothetical protein
MDVAPDDTRDLKPRASKYDILALYQQSPVPSTSVPSIAQFMPSSAYGVAGQSTMPTPYSGTISPSASIDTSQTTYSPVNNPYQQHVTPTSMRQSIPEYRTSPVPSPLTMPYQQTTQPPPFPTPSAQQSSNPFYSSYSTPRPSTTSSSPLPTPYYSSNLAPDYPAAPVSSSAQTPSPDPFASLASSILPSFGMSGSASSSQNRVAPPNYPQNSLSESFPQPHTTPPNQAKLGIPNPQQYPSPSHPF